MTNEKNNLNWDVQSMVLFSQEEYYGYEGFKKMQQISDEQLAQMQSVEIEQRDLSQLLNSARFKDVFVVWGKGKLGIVKLGNGASVRIAISEDFFSLFDHRGIFKFEGEALKKWENLFFSNQ